MNIQIEKALSTKNYHYVGYSTTGKIFYIYRPPRKGTTWIVRNQDMIFKFFKRTLKEVKEELGNR